MNKTWLAIGAIVVLGLIVWGVSSMGGKSADTSTGPIKVGVIVPLTGDAAVYGEPGRNITQLAVDEINAAGGINGREMELIVEDGKCNGQDAASATQKLVNVDKVQVIIGAFCSGESLAAVPVAASGKVAMISPGSSSPKLTDVSPYFVRNYPSDATQGSVLANIAYTDKGYKKIAFIQEQTDYAAGVYTAFSNVFSGLGGTVTNEAFPTETSDFRSIISKVKGQNPDAVFIDTQTPAVTGRILAQMEQLGWKPKLFVSDILPGDTKTVEAHKAILEGTLAAEVGVDPSNPKFAALLVAYKAKYGVELPFQSYAQTEYDSVYLVRDAILAVGNDGTKVAAWLHTVKDWQGAAGSVTIGTNGDPVAGHRPEVIMAGKPVPYVK
ncbi:MAG: ABC transporter substrate-binding protein [Patescibacteria group bacterium]